jgi:hypothetical protein
MVGTLVLKNRGAKDPSRHFMIWEWMVGPTYPKIVRRYYEEKGRYYNASAWYVGMIISKKPLVRKRRQKALGWYHQGVRRVRLSYLKDYLEHGEFSDVMRMIETDDFSRLVKEGMDSAVVTQDRPFPSLSKKEVPEVTRLLKSGGAVFALLTIVFMAGVLFRAPARRALYSGIHFGYQFTVVGAVLLNSIAGLLGVEADPQVIQAGKSGDTEKDAHEQIPLEREREALASGS